MSTVRRYGRMSSWGAPTCHPPLLTERTSNLLIPTLHPGMEARYLIMLALIN